MALTKVQQEITTITGTGGGSKNYIANGAAELNTTGWATYNESRAVTFSAGVALVNLTAHGLKNDDRVSFPSVVTTTGIATNVLYYGRVSTADVFRIYDLPGGASAVAFAPSGSGTMAIPQPILGTGGTPSVTFTRSTTTPLAGLASFLFTKAASNSQGQGASYDFTIDAQDKSKVLQISANYLVSSGTFVAGSSGVESDVTVWIYDVTNAVMIQPSSYKLLSSSTTLSDKFSATFQTSPNSVSYRLIFHVGSASALAYQLQFDSISVSPSVYVYGSPVTDWQPYTPAFVGVGTPSNVAMEWRRVGGSLEIKGRFTFGTPSATIASFSFPGGLVTAETTTRISGTISRSAGVGAYSKTYSIITTGGSSVANIGNNADADSSDPAAPALGNALSTSGQTMLIRNFSTPIQGWSSSVQMSDGSTAAVVDFVGYVSANQALTTAVTDLPLTARKDSHGAWTGSAYRIPFAGDYQFSLHMVYSAAISNNLKIYVNGTAVRRLGVSFSSVICIGSATVEDLKVGDLVSIRSSDAGCTINADAQSHLSIIKVQGPQTIAASETISASYFMGTSATTSATAPINYDTKIWDTNGAVTTGAAWKFTAPAPGKYQVSILTLSSGAGGGWIGFYKNGTLTQRFGYHADLQSNPQNTTLFVALLSGEYFDVRAISTFTALGGALSGGPCAITVVRVGN